MTGQAVGKLRLIETRSGQRVALSNSASCPNSVRLLGIEEFSIWNFATTTLLTREQAIALQLEMYELLSKPRFQAAVTKLNAEGLPNLMRARAMRALLLEEQKTVIPRYGFEASMDGVVKMLNAYMVFTMQLDKDVVGINDATLQLYTAQPEQARMQYAPGGALEFKCGVAPGAAPEVGDDAREGAVISAAPVPSERPAEAPQGMQKVTLRFTGVQPVMASVMLPHANATVATLRQFLSEISEEALRDVKIASANRGASTMSALADAHRLNLTGRVTVIGCNDIRAQLEAMPPGVVLLSEAQALAMQGELTQRYSTPTFQKKLRDLDARSVQDRYTGLRNLCYEEQQHVLPMFGFEVSETGVLAMISSFRFHRHNQKIKDATANINTLLGSGQKFQAVAPPVVDPEHEIPVKPVAPESSKQKSESLEGVGKKVAWKWKVIGGRETGGIIVRCGASAKSEQIGRLQYGATIDEVSCVGDRLEYTLVKGVGPETGWVSFEVRGKDLLDRVV
eukprot:NODE_738_length_2792_cov_10.323827.p1 GENE.NODE_738_length_2792_cov_10.323827~~NODE_738_length_2792_cov_10.323827.p1  ORF type:complete len:595 (-),score=163.32 NODE_738_length_2792_cov_10.323827:1008-2534(-)